MSLVEDERGPEWVSAVQDFWRARRRATLREFLGNLTRSGHPLMSFEDVRRKLRAVETPGRELTEVPLDRIVGSVGRYNDFTRGFMPRQDSDRARWTAVRMAMTGMRGLPPIELYRIGDAYFVRDGNHRVSVARQLGMEFIQAWVTTLHTRVSLPADTSPEGLIIKSEELDFLARTRIDELRPGADLTVTAAGQYARLLEHISVHRWFMGIERQAEVSEDEAVTHWYDTVYMPVVAQINRLDLLRGFEGRTVTDLYLWLGEQRGRLWRELGFRLPTDAVAEGVAGDLLSSQRPGTPAARQRLLEEARGGSGNLYADILVGLDGSESDRNVFRLSLTVAARGGGAIYALQLASGPGTDALLAGFAAEAEAAGIEAQFVTHRGNPAEELLDRSLYSDLVVLSSGRLARSVVRRCRRPLLLASGEPTLPGHLLLAFDGRRRSEDAMLHAAWLALAWGSRISVVTVAASGAPAERILDRARRWLTEQEVEADFLQRSGPVAQTLAATAAGLGCDTIVMGSWKYSSWLETMLGGIPDEVMTKWDRQLLIV